MAKKIITFLRIKRSLNWSYGAPWLHAILRIILPPIAIVRVTPIILDRDVVTPSMLKPTADVSLVMNHPIAPMLPSNMLKLRACRPGSKVGGEAKRPEI